MTSISDILKLDAKATAGPWRFDPGGSSHVLAKDDQMTAMEARGWGHLTGASMKLSDDEAIKIQDANCKATATYRTACPELARDLERLVILMCKRADGLNEYRMATQLAMKWGIE